MLGTPFTGSESMQFNSLPPHQTHPDEEEASSLTILATSAGRRLGEVQCSASGQAARIRALCVNGGAIDSSSSARPPPPIPLYRFANNSAMQVVWRSLTGEALYPSPSPHK